MKRRWMLWVLVFAGLVPGLARGQGFTERGAAVGGIAGALTGAAIGKHNNNTGIGALVGGAVGLATGAAIGSSQDAEIARTRAYQQQQIQWQNSRAVSPHDVVTMARNGLSDPLIINHIHQNGVQRRLEVSDVITLHQQGISESVITALQRAPVASAHVTVAPPRPAPVIVQEHYYAPPVYIHRPPYHHYPRHYHPGVSGRVMFGF